MQLTNVRHSLSFVGATLIVATISGKTLGGLSESPDAVKVVYNAFKVNEGYVDQHVVLFNSTRRDQEIVSIQRPSDRKRYDVWCYSARIIKPNAYESITVRHEGGATNAERNILIIFRD